MDFTIRKYRQWLEAFIAAGYTFQTFSEYLTSPNKGKTIIMRHDVDEFAFNALKMAKVENQLGIKATYYFRIVKQSNKPNIIKQIAALKHEIGYHYEDLAFAKGDMAEAIRSFSDNLTYFRTYYPITSVCMHGSSTSEFDNRQLWSQNKLSDFGLLGEPYLSINFDEVFYLTDTGYAWDGAKYSFRDFVKNNFNLSFHSTDDIISCIKEGNYPNQSLILSHTEWNDNLWQWTILHIREYLRYKVKYLAKRNTFILKIYKALVNFYWKRD